MAVEESGRLPFTQLQGRLKPQLLNALKKHGFNYMTPVQEQVLQRPTFTQDILVQAKTGTGKTLAFLLPALQTLLEAKDLDYASVALLVLVPTRELAQQIKEECDKVTSECTQRLECHIAVGGTNRRQLLAKFLKGSPTILVATPGRLNDYLGEDAARQKFSKIRCVVLDEVDQMLDFGFAPALRQILQQIPTKAELGWQGMCFSATVAPETRKMLPMVLSEDYARISTIDENEAPTIETVPQTVYPVSSVADIMPTLHSVLSCARADNPKLKAVIFCPTARHAGLLYHVFGYKGGAAPPKLSVFQMQSRMSQAMRTRTVREFKEADRGLLFASDVVGRGMDFPDVDLVVQIGVPAESDQYVHRVGRTGRAGKGGEAVMILAPEEMWFVRNNPQFPIKNGGTFAHPKASLYPSASIIRSALEKVDYEAKEAAYVATLGFIKSLMKRYGLDRTGVVELANRFGVSFGCGDDGPPALKAQTVGKMGLRGVPGLVVEGQARGSSSGGGGGPARNGGNSGGGNVENGAPKNGPEKQSGGGAGRGSGRGGRRGRGGRGGGGRGGGPERRRRQPEGSGTNGEEPSRKRARR
ncbi:hypothetical protein VTI28DRAFT_6656 [Corynascus sepedonium]